MSTDLTDFLIDLAKDPKKTEAFKKDPKKVMDDAGLSQEDQEILTSGDPQKIRNAIDKEKMGDSVVTIIFISVMLD